MAWCFVSGINLTNYNPLKDHVNILSHVLYLFSSGICTANICRGSTHWTTQPCRSLTLAVSTLRKVLGMRLHSTALMVCTSRRGGHWGTGFLCSLLKMAEDRGMAFWRGQTSTWVEWGTHFSMTKKLLKEFVHWVVTFCFLLQLKKKKDTRLPALKRKVILNCMNKWHCERGQSQSVCELLIMSVVSVLPRFCLVTQASLFFFLLQTSDTNTCRWSSQ